MAIRTVVTRGYGNGTFNGTIKEVILKGYSVSPLVGFVAAWARHANRLIGSGLQK